MESAALQRADRRRDFQAIIGIDFYREIVDPNSPDFQDAGEGTIISLVGGGSNSLIYIYLPESMVDPGGALSYFFR